MDITHSLSGSTEGIEEAIKSLNIKYTATPLLKRGTLIHFDIKESDKKWLAVHQLMQQYKFLDMYDTIFTNQEILAAEWVRLLPRFNKGYPQPEVGWDELVYKDHCSKCGAGYTQRAPFYITQQRMFNNDILSLYWTNTLFCTPKVIEVMKYENILGLEIWDAIMFRSKMPSPDLFQIVPKNVTKPGLADEDKIKPVVCPCCGIAKYAYHKRGYMHFNREALNQITDIQLTYEWFGSGGFAFQEILISQRFAKLILDNKWKTVQLKPVILT